MKTIWITYSWEDNKNGDVEFIAQELEKAGITVKMDRWNIQAGKRLWEQIDKFITDPNECDAWVLIATQSSLSSQPCREEVAYALQRALNTRGESFPFIGIFPSSIDADLIPTAIKSRLYVSLKDSDWIERVKSSIENRVPDIQKKILEPYTVEFRSTPFGKNALEIRPRAGSWVPFFCAIPNAEKDAVKPKILRGPKGNAPGGGILMMASDEQSDDGSWWINSAGDEATPTMSYYFFYETLPSKILFGVFNSQPQFILTLK